MQEQKMSTSQIKTYYQIVTETWQLFHADLDRLRPDTQYLDEIVPRYVEYENKWINTPYWKFAGAECSAKLQALHREWEAAREGNHQS